MEVILPPPFFLCFFLLFGLPADAVSNAAGYGFLGMDENGKPSWDLISNLNIVGIEVPSVFVTAEQTSSLFITTDLCDSCSFCLS